MRSADVARPSSVKLRSYLVWMLGPLALFSGCGGCGSNPEVDADFDGYTIAMGDCDDTKAAVNPGAAEICDDLDNDCDNGVDEGLEFLDYYYDGDRDGVGVTSTGLSACTEPKYYVLLDGDCDDSRDTVYPDAVEDCDGLDNDCDDQIDEGLRFSPFYTDADSDGFGTSVAVRTGCDEQDGQSRARGDCNDHDPSIYPGATEVDGDGVDSDCGGTQNRDPHVGLSSTSLQSLAEALTQAQPGMTIWVGPGTYPEHDLSFAGKAAGMMSTEGPAVTFVDAAKAGRGFIFNSGEGSGTFLVGFTVINGNAERGAGVRTYGTSPRLEELVLTNNSATIDGGGFNVGKGSPVLRDIIVENNSAAGWGGGGFSDSGAVLTLENFTARGNTATYGAGISAKNVTFILSQANLVDNIASISSGTGGGIAIVGGSACTLERIYLLGNSAWKGGGIFIQDSSPTLNTLSVMDNEAVTGAGIYLANSSPSITQTSIVANTSTSNGGGIYLYGATSSPTFVNSTLAYNSMYNIFDDASNAGTLSFTTSHLFAAPGELNHNVTPAITGIISTEPAFLEMENGLPVSLHLSTTSPLVDAGSAGTTDPDGTRADIGTFGGALAGAWDVDQDGYYDYFWPGYLENAPTGYSSADYDCDDQDGNVGLCL